ncbi:MAG: TrkA family potassium uptake protein [bacterium]|jgi:trk system potassium uptake protein TrkA
MYVVVGGIGLVGGELARRLIDNKHDVVVIDSDKEICDRMYAETGVVAIHGNISQVETLKEANVHKADVVAATTGSDADNLACAILAKSFGVTDVIARMRNPHYKNAYKLVGVTSVLHVTDLMVNQMIIEIEKPRVRKVLSVGGGKADIYSVVIPETARVAGKTVESIARDPHFPPTCVFVAVFNREKDELSIPRGQQVIHQGDELLLISPAGDMKKVTDFLLG